MAVLKWGTPISRLPAGCQGPFDFVVGSDIVYGYKRNYRALLRTLREVEGQVLVAVPARAGRGFPRWLWVSCGCGRGRGY